MDEGYIPRPRGMNKNTLNTIGILAIVAVAVVGVIAITHKSTSTPNKLAPMPSKAWPNVGVSQSHESLQFSRPNYGGIYRGYYNHGGWGEGASQRHHRRG